MLDKEIARELYDHLSEDNPTVGVLQWGGRWVVGQWLLGAPPEAILKTGEWAFIPQFAHKDIRGLCAKMGFKPKKEGET